jgi:hypothetical protein
MANRAGSTVNMAGAFEGVPVKRKQPGRRRAKGLEGGDAMEPRWREWGTTGSVPSTTLTNEDGLFTEFDGSVSRAIHQYDRFGRPM